MNINLSRSFFIGGAPCSGKSSLAERLARDLGMPYYKCDDHFSRHMEEAAAAGLQFAKLVKSVTHEYIFMRTDPENVEFALQVHGEEFEFIMRDIGNGSAPVIAEGVSLLPGPMADAGIPRENLFYLVPTASFHRDKYLERTWARDRLQETSNPDQAYENWMRRDAIMAEEIFQEARSKDFRAVRVDHSTDFENLYATIRQQAQKALA